MKATTDWRTVAVAIAVGAVLATLWTGGSQRLRADGGDGAPSGRAGRYLALLGGPDRDDLYMIDTQNGKVAVYNVDSNKYLMLHSLRDVRYDFQGHWLGTREGVSQKQIKAEWDKQEKGSGE